MTKQQSLDVGILILRVGIGLLFIMHGWPKLIGGPEGWAGLGGSMSVLGINFAPAFWGFMAAIAEFFGGILLIIGLFVQPASFFMFFTMFVATIVKMQSDEPLGFLGAIKQASHPLALAIVFLALMFIGAGSYALSAKFEHLADKWYG